MSSASKDKLKHFELILKRIHGFKEEGTMTQQIDTPETMKKR